MDTGRVSLLGSTTRLAASRHAESLSGSRQRAAACGRQTVQPLHCSSVRPRSTTLNVSTIVSDMKTECTSKATTTDQAAEDTLAEVSLINAPLKLERLLRRQRRIREQMIYKVSAIAASVGITGLAIAAVHLRFSWHPRDGGEFPTFEAFCTFLLVAGGAIGMEMYARFAHKVLWHDFLPGWALHKSHHEPRIGPFEANDIYAIANAVPAMALCAYGFVTPTIAGGLCFGAGLGITVFGISYMFVHDGLVHKRFPVGPIAEVPYLKRVAVAHRLHHSEKYGGVPWGLFLGPQELEAIGAKDELDQLVAQVNMSSKPQKDSSA